MHRTLLAIALSLLATAALGADLRVTAEWPQEDKLPGQTASLLYRLRNLSADPAHNIRFNVSANAEFVDVALSVSSLASSCHTTTAPRGSTLECTLDQLGASSDAYIYFFGKAPLTAGPIVVTATATSPDDNAQDNNTAAYSFEVLDEPDLNVSLTGIDASTAFDPEEKTSISVAVGNVGARAATQVELNVDFPEGTKILSRSGGETFDCDLDAKPVRCRTASLPVTSTATPKPTIRFRVSTPPLYEGGSMTVEAHVRAMERDLRTNDNDLTRTAKIRRFFGVTNTADDGPGSLRQAILDANALCGTDCTLGFRIPGGLPPEGFLTIRPRTPLPAINFLGLVNGATQANFLDLETERPLVMLDGSLVASGDGLWLQSTAGVHSLAIGNFPASGIYLESTPTSKRQYSSSIRHVYLGLDPTGHIAAPNERGLVDRSASGLLEVTESVISGNRRSGIVVSNRRAYIVGNRIGVAAESDAPLPNGASGIFLLMEMPASLFSVEAQVLDNVIAYHPDFGVALYTPVQQAILVSRNSIYGNGANSIDYGLDGHTPNVADDSRRFPNHPTIASARCDVGCGSTTITIELDTRAHPTLFPGQDHDPHYPLVSSSDAWVEVYANDTNDGQNERYLGSVKLGALSPDRATFLRGELAVHEDLRGKWITAVTIRTLYEVYIDIPRLATETSESSPPVVVW